MNRTAMTARINEDRFADRCPGCRGDGYIMSNCAAGNARRYECDMCNGSRTVFGCDIETIESEGKKVAERIENNRDDLRFYEAVIRGEETWAISYPSAHTAEELAAGMIPQIARSLRADENYIGRLRAAWRTLNSAA